MNHRYYINQLVHVVKMHSIKPEDDIYSRNEYKIKALDLDKNLIWLHNVKVPINLLIDNVVTIDYD